LAENGKDLLWNHAGRDKSICSTIDPKKGLKLALITLAVTIGIGILTIIIMRSIIIYLNRKEAKDLELQARQMGSMKHKSNM